MCVDESGPAEIIVTCLGFSGSHQSDSEIVACKSFESFDIEQAFQHRCRFRETAAGHVDLGTQEKQVVAYGVRDLAFDPIQGVKRIFRSIFVKIDTCQAIQGLVADRVGYVSFDDGGDGSPGPLVHAVGEFEIADRELGLPDMMIKSVQLGLIEAVMLLQLGIKTREGLEPVLL